MQIKSKSNTKWCDSVYRDEALLDLEGLVFIFPLGNGFLPIGGAERESNPDPHASRLRFGIIRQHALETNAHLRGPSAR